jgi:2-methylfumaryl-CoA hydratase
MTSNVLASKTVEGNFFEDFFLGQEIRHATPRTVTEGDTALYMALTGNRFVIASSEEFARSLGYSKAPVDDMVAFHVVFGKTVPDISLNAIANLGYADGKFGVPVYPGDTLKTVSTVIGLKENSNKQTGVVYVRSEGTNQDGEMVLSYVRWVMVRKRSPDAPTPEAHIPQLPSAVSAEDLVVPRGLSFEHYDTVLSGSAHLWEDFEVGERIDHVDGMTIEEAEHALATRLWQNTAKVHFNQHTEGKGRFGRRLIYGGHIISLARALSFNGLANTFKIAAINGGRHANPTFAGDTVYAWSEILDKAEISGRTDLGALRIRMVATKDRECHDFPLKTPDGKEFLADVLLEFDYWVLIPRRR